jgi:hypothetical protein
MDPGDPKAVNDGIVALLGAILAASIFTLGFLSNRSHAALRDAKRHLETAGGDPERRKEHADALLKDAQSWIILGVNFALAAGIAVVVFPLTDKSGIGGEGWTTLLGFLVLEAAVVGLALYDHFHVAQALERSKDRAS